MGGIVSSLTGSGLDIMTFTLLTLYFRVSEKVATPTSVVLMAGNAVVGFVWRGAVQRQLPLEAWNFWYVCIPVVVVGRDWEPISFAAGRGTSWRSCFMPRLSCNSQRRW